jgi:hypothetical protein
MHCGISSDDFWHSFLFLFVYFLLWRDSITPSVIIIPIVPLLFLFIISLSDLGYISTLIWQEVSHVVLFWTSCQVSSLLYLSTFNINTFGLRVRFRELVWLPTNLGVPTSHPLPNRQSPLHQRCNVSFFIGIVHWVAKAGYVKRVASNFRQVASYVKAGGPCGRCGRGPFLSGGPVAWGF